MRYCNAQNARLSISSVMNELECISKVGRLYSVTNYGPTLYYYHIKNNHDTVYLLCTYMLFYKTLVKFRFVE